VPARQPVAAVATPEVQESGLQHRQREAVGARKRSVAWQQQRAVSQWREAVDWQPMVASLLHPATLQKWEGAASQLQLSVV
jgi:hypothetical protein